MKQLIGPIKQLITMNHLPKTGAISDDKLEVITKAGIVIADGRITQIGDFAKLAAEAILKNRQVIELKGDYVATPGLIDAHTHMCYGGSRAGDYAKRVAGCSYQEIAASGGGIKDSVRATRAASTEQLYTDLKNRAFTHLKRGITTCEVKSGYGLNLEHELNMLKVINKVNADIPIDLVPTCLAAHVCPEDFSNSTEYLTYLVNVVIPELHARQITNRIDIFMEENAFSKEDADFYLAKVKELGFELTIHADQFTTGGSEYAVKYGAISADHLEASGDTEIAMMAKAGVIGTVLPGASLGLGMNFAPARKMLDAGMSVVIASDWNPGSAPMGDLLLQAAVIGAAEKLSMAETWAGITSRAANALNSTDKGSLKTGNAADILFFQTADYREILYNQGMLKPEKVVKNGVFVA